MTAFEFQTTEDLTFFEVKLTGELIGGSDFDSDKFKTLVKQIRTHAQSRIVFIDISHVKFWDTEGMRQTLGLASEINEKVGTRVYIICPKDGYLYKRAKEKYKEKIDTSIPWKNDKSGLLA